MSLAICRVLIGLALLLSFFGMSPVANAISCGALNTVDRSLPGGARWEMCWRADAKAGIVFSDVHFTTETGIRRKVLKEAGLGQMNVILNDNSARYSHVTGVGLGGNSLKAIGNANCQGGVLRSDNGRKVMCESIESRGYAWKYYGTSRQGNQLTLSSLIKLPTGKYVMRWVFADDGVIAPAMGHAGDIKFVGTDAAFGWRVGSAGASQVIAKSFAVEYIWRMDLDIGANPYDDIVEMLEVNPDSIGSRKFLNITQINSESSYRLNALNKRSWRIRDGVENNADGHKVSYHLEPVESGSIYRGASNEAWSQNDIYITRVRGCERFATDNVAGCGASVDRFVDGEPIVGSDPVLWYRTTYHRLPREEDRDGYHIGWSGFHLTPRDWTATSSLN